MEKQSSQPQVKRKEIVTKVAPNDILLGRGALAIGHEGNIRFRSLIKERKKEYMSTNKRRKKDIIATEIRAEVVRRNGRFIRRVSEEADEFTALGIPRGVEGRSASKTL